MSTILLSFDADTFLKLERGGKKFEHRKHLPDGETKVIFYVSHPIKAISGIAEFGCKEELIGWLDKFGDRPQEVIDRINDYLTDCNYVAPIYKFQPTNRIPLDKLREDIPGFIVPRMYYYLDNLPLLDYLEKELVPTGEVITHSFDVILDDEICTN